MKLRYIGAIILLIVGLFVLPLVIGQPSGQYPKTRAIADRYGYPVNDPDNPDNVTLWYNVMYSAPTSQYLPKSMTYDVYATVNLTEKEDKINSDIDAAIDVFGENLGYNVVKVVKHNYSVSKPK